MRCLRFLVGAALLLLVFGAATPVAAALADYDNYTNTSRIDWCASDTDYVYFGTFGGLKRYNKAFGTWTVYTTSDNLNDNWVYCMQLVGNRLWLGTFAGLNYSDNYGATITPVADADVDNEIILCMEDTGSYIWASTYSGLRRSTDNGASWSAISAEQMNDLCWAGDTLWAGTFNLQTGLCGSYDNGVSWWKIPVLGDTEVYSVENYYETIVVGSWGSGVYVSGDSGVTWDTYAVGDGLGSNYIYDIAISDGGKTYWAACATNNATGGISKSTDGGRTWTNYTFVNGYNSAFTVWVDGNRVWAGTVGGGISVTVDNGSNWTTYTAINGIGDVQPDRTGVPFELQGVVNVYGVSVYNNIIWAACTPGGVSKSTDNGASWTTYTVLNGGLPDTDAQAVAAGAGAVWAGTDNGLSRTTNNGASWTNYSTGNGLGSNNILSIMLHDDTVYVGTAENASGGGGLSKSGDNGASWSNYSLKGAYGAGADTVNGIAAVYNNLWIATNNGVLRSQNDGDSWSQFTTDTAGIPSNLVYDVAVTMDTVWIVTDLGVAKSSPPYMTWQQYTTVSGFDTNANYCVEVNGDWIWIGSSRNGGFTYSANDGASWTNIKTTTAASGLIENYLYDVDVDGNYVYWGAKNGITRFDYKYPEVTITSPEHGEILTAGIEAITGSAIDYTAINSWDLYYDSGAYPNNAGSWTQIGSNGSANTANSLLQAWNVSELDAGDYTLRLRATDGGNMNTQYIVINIPVTGAIVFTSPAANSEVGGVITIAVTASDSDGVAAVEWQYSLDSSNGVNGSWIDCVADSGSNPDSFAPYDFRWQTLPASGTDNQVWLRARLLDSLGFYSSYTTHLIAVNNTALDPTIAQTVTASDQNASLYLPPNALAGATVVTLTPSTSIPAHPTAGINSISVGYDVYPDGTSLNKPGTLEIKWTDAQAAGFTEGNFTLYGWNSTTSEWEKVGGTLDAGANSLTAAITSFKMYAVMEDNTGAGGFAGGISQVNAQPRVFTPNGGGGFSDHLDISFTLGAPETVTLKVYSMNGRLRRLLVDEVSKPVGSNVVVWDGRDDDGELVPNGLYIVTITAGGTTETKTVVVMSK